MCPHKAVTLLSHKEADSKNKLSQLPKSYSQLWQLLFGPNIRPAIWELAVSCKGSLEYLWARWLCAKFVISARWRLGHRYAVGRTDFQMLARVLNISLEIHRHKQSANKQESGES